MSLFKVTLACLQYCTLISNRSLILDSENLKKIFKLCCSNFCSSFQKILSLKKKGKNQTYGQKKEFCHK